MSVSGNKILALKSDGTGYEPLKLDSTGKLRVIAEATSISAAAINLNTDTLETLQTNIFNKFDNVVGHINNTGAIGDGSDILKSMSLGYDRANGKGVSFLVDSAGKLDIQHIESIDTRLDNSIGAINNTGAVGEGSSQLRVVPLGYDRANGVGRSILVDSLGHIQTDIVSGTITLPSGAATSANQATIIGHVDGVETSLTAITGYVDGIETLIGTTNTNITTMDAVMDNILTKNTEIDAVLDTINGKITACNTGAVVISSGAITASLSATDNAVLDAIATDGDNVQTLLTTIDGVLDSSLTKQGEIDAVLDTISGKITACNTGAVVISSGAITASLSATDNAVLDAIATDGDNVQTLLTTMDGVMDNILTKNTEIDAVLDTINGKITACNTGAVVISSGAVTATLSATDNAVLDTIDAVLDTIKVDTEAIETAVELLSANVGTAGEWLSSAAIGDDAYGASVLDVSAYSKVRLMGKANSDIGMAGIPVLGSQTSGGTYYNLGQTEKLNQTTIAIGGSNEYHLYTIIEHCPNFLKIYNNTGGSKTLELDYIGYVN